MGDVLNTILPDFWRCFVPLFVAVDAVGLLPIYMALTEGFSAPTTAASSSSPRPRRWPSASPSSGWAARSSDFSK